MRRKEERQAQTARRLENRLIPTPRIPAGNGAKLSFSFKYLDCSHEKFHLSACTPDFYAALLEQLKIYETWTVDQFTQADADHHRHPIIFEDTTVLEGFPLDDQLQGTSEDYWQFCVDPRERWRVHGFIINPTFFIVWLDPLHQLSP